jgi:hypothetical protein
MRDVKPPIAQKPAKEIAEQWADRITALHRGISDSIDELAIKNIKEKFADKHGSDAKLVQDVTSVLTKRYAESRSEDDKVLYATSLVFLSLSLARSNEKLAKQTWLSPQPKSYWQGTASSDDVKSLDAVKERIYFAMDITGLDKEKYDKSISKIRKGSLPSDDCGTLTVMLIQEYNTFSEFKMVRNMKRMMDVIVDMNRNLALRHADLEKQLDHQKKEAEFGKMRKD